MIYLKKADIEVDMILKLLLALIILLIVIGLIFMIKNKSFSTLKNVFDILRFGS